MYLKFLAILLLINLGSCEFHDEAEDTKVLSEVWEAMDKHKGDDIILIPHHHEEEHEGPKGPEESPKPHEEEPHSPEEGPKPHEEGPEHHDEGPKSHDEGPSKPDMGPEGPHDEKTLVQKLVYKLNRLGDIMGRAVEQLRRDDIDIQMLKSGQNRTGTALSVIDIVGAVILGIIVLTVLILGIMKGVSKIKTWRANRESQRLVDPEAPNMDGTGYQSGYNP